MSQLDLAYPGGGPVDLNYKPQVDNGGGRGDARSGDRLPLWGILAKEVVIPQKIR